MLLVRMHEFNEALQVIGRLNSGFIRPSRWFHASCSGTGEIEHIVKVINEHCFPDQPLQPTLERYINPASLSPSFVNNVLGRLFAAHANGLKACEFFKFCLFHPDKSSTPDAFEKTIHILTRMRYFDKAWELMAEIKETHPSLLTLKSMNIMLSRIAKSQSYEDTLEAFEKLERDIFVGKKFGTEEFNALLHAFCTQRQMKEAKSVFNKLHSRFAPNTKTMNILLLGFKEAGNVTSVELFYHEMIRRGFKPNYVTYNIRIDAYCKKGRLGDALRLLKEMESVNHCLPTLQTMTTLIYGAGIARNISKARELFHEIPKRNLTIDVCAYNALLSSLLRSRDIKAAVELMEEMDEKKICHDHLTYHTMFWGLIRLKDVHGVYGLYNKMTEQGFLPKTRSVVMLIKFFCENQNIDLGLSFWNYLLVKGQCPHSHALDLLVTALCSHGRVEEALECSKQMMDRGRHISGLVFQMLKRILLESGEEAKLHQLEEMMKKLEILLPPSNVQYKTHVPCC
ncbi:unnamed protein product [Cuscuta epithymum]|uniref:Pentatricopeptide repeat-containing protein n=1 Tax=Cuscuta epithymum TaxID=186058 RepID=A0AAV0DD64_9ASTE|nr:unnamed protein product [Cuscuta epithymum]